MDPHFSTAQGRTWEEVGRISSDPISSSGLSALLLSPTFARDGTMIYSVPNGLGSSHRSALSSDGGRTWQPIAGYGVEVEFSPTYADDTEACPLGKMWGNCQG